MNPDMNENINKMAQTKLTKHKQITDGTIEEQATELYRFHMMLGGWMISQADSYQGTIVPKELINLLKRHRNFGVLGQLTEGEMFVQDFDIMKSYSLLEELYSTKHYASLFKSDSSIIRTTMLAARARLEVVISEGVDFNKLYNLSNDVFPTTGQIELNELAAIADMSLQSVRNQISQGNAGFNTQQKDGKYYVAVDEAKLWLKQRNSFKPTIISTEVHIREQEEDVLLVPVARDGSYFNSVCARNGTFTVGEKGDEKKFIDYILAREYLMKMPLAKWRRPNISGNWGIVSAIEWKFMPRNQVLI